MTGAGQKVGGETNGTGVEAGSLDWMMTNLGAVLRRLEKLDKIQDNQKQLLERVASCEERFAKIQCVLGYDAPEQDVAQGILMGLGNPLLDVIVPVEAPVLRKFGLKANDAIIAAAKHKPLFELIQTPQFKPVYLAGGATQNSIRVAQWLLKLPQAVTFFGCVGSDKDGNKLEEVAEEGGVKVVYQRHQKETTGTCAALLTGHDRSLVTSLGAAIKFSHEFLSDPKNWKVVEKAEVIYVGGFVFDVSVKSIEMLSRHAAEKGKTLVMNLSAPFLIKYFADKKINILQYIDVLFGNQDEARELAKALKLGSQDVKVIARKIMDLPKANGNRKRSVVFTGGREATIVGWEGGEPFENNFDPVAKEKIVDTNACGDAFVGGFLAQLVRKKDVAVCLKCANYAASVIIQHNGCSFPDQPTFRLH